MKKRNLKAIFLVMAMIMSVSVIMPLSGCKNGGNKDAYTKDNKLKIEIFADSLDCLQAPTKDSKKIIDIIENKFAIKFDAKTATPTTWQKLLNQSIAGGDCPDVFFHMRKEPSYSKWLDEKLLYNFSDDLNSYPNIKKVFDTFGSPLKNLLGGDYYSYPIILRDDLDTRTDYLLKDHTEHSMFYRREWYTNLVSKNYVFPSDYTRADGSKFLTSVGVKDPEDITFDYLDFYDIAYAFTYGDPDGNGENDTTGYGLNNELYWWYPILSMFGVGIEQWEVNAEGGWEPEVYSEQMKKAVWFMAKMYDDGLINKDYNTNSTIETQKNKFVNGTYGIMTYNSTFPMGNGVLKLIDDAQPSPKKAVTDIVRGFPVVIGENGKRQIAGPLNNYGYTAINNGCSKVKKAKILELMNWLLSDEGRTLMDWGIEGTHYTIDKTTKEKSSILPYVSSSSSRRKFLHDDTIAPVCFRLKAFVSWNTYINKDVEYYSEQKVVNSAWDTKYVEINRLNFVTAGSSYSTTVSELSDSVEVAFMKIVTNNTTESKRQADWNKFVTYYKNKGEKYITAMDLAAKNAGVTK